MQKNLIIILTFVGLIGLSGCGNKAGWEMEDTSFSDTVQKDNDLETSEIKDNFDFEDNKKPVSKVAVYVCGAVNNPGVYYLEQGAIKQDALLAAGGLSEDAEVFAVNLAEKVSDGEKIYFPKEGENTFDTSTATGNTDEMAGLIDINHADVDTLMTLPGIGRSRAMAIVKYRDEQGVFRSVSDITNVNGIKAGVYDNIKDLICVR